MSKQYPRKAILEIFLSLRGRLILLICLATLPAILFAVLIAKNERSATLDRAKIDISNLARIVTRQHTYQIVKMKILLKQLGLMVSHGQGGESLFLMSPELINSLFMSHSELANLGFIAPDGKVLRSATPIDRFPNMQTNIAFQKALISDEVESGDYIIGPLVKKPILNLAYAIRDKNKKIKMIIFCALNLEWSKELNDQIKLPKDYLVFILNQVGKVLLVVSDTVEIPGADELLHYPELVNNKDNVLTKVNANGSKYYFSSARMSAAPYLNVAVGLPYEKITLEANATFFRVLRNLGLITFVVIVSVLFVTEISILRIIRTLLNLAKKIGAGDLNSRAKLTRRHGELYELALEFNSMADSLQSRHDEMLILKNQLRALSQHLQLSKEEEATKIARELHDELGQLLTTIKIELMQMNKRCFKIQLQENCNDNIKRIVELNQKIDEGVVFIRRISSELRPNVLDRLGPILAIEWQINEFEKRSDISFVLKASVEDEIKDDLVSVTLFRIAQEALNNVVKHSAASKVNINITQETGEINMTIEDNGIGVNINILNKLNAFGIIGMRERASLVDGAFSVFRNQLGGTTVELKIPIKS